MTGPLVVWSCDAHLVREDVRERRLAEARRAAREDVIERLAAPPRGLDEDVEVVLVLRLADVVVEGPRPERPVEARVVPADHGIERSVEGRRVIAREGRRGRDTLRHRAVTLADHSFARYSPMAGSGRTSVTTPARTAAPGMP